MCLYSSSLISPLFHLYCKEILIRTWRLPATFNWFHVHRDVLFSNLEKMILKNPSSISLVSGITTHGILQSISLNWADESESNTRCLAQYSESSSPCRISLKASNLKRMLLWILKYSRDNMIFKIIRRILILPLKKTYFLINIYTVNTYSQRSQFNVLSILKLRSLACHFNVNFIEVISEIYRVSFP